MAIIRFCFFVFYYIVFQNKNLINLVTSQITGLKYQRLKENAWVLTLTKMESSGNLKFSNKE